MPKKWRAENRIFRNFSKKQVIRAERSKDKMEEDRDGEAEGKGVKEKPQERWFSALISFSLTFSQSLLLFLSPIAALVGTKFGVA